jgi:hypothetical protein
VKLEAYECGIEATSDAFATRFSVRYFLIAVLFIIFDVETIFLFPWAIRFKQLGWFGAIEMAIFIGILLVGYFYAWKRDVLTWLIETDSTATSSRPRTTSSSTGLAGARCGRCSSASPAAPSR